MSYGDLLKKLLMAPAYAHAAAIAVRERFDHANRKRLGDPANRAKCCDPLPGEFPLKKRVVDIPELVNKIEHVGTINTGLTRWFACRTCGQEWREDQESVGNFAEYPHVRKAT